MSLSLIISGGTGSRYFLIIPDRTSHILPITVIEKKANSLEDRLFQRVQVKPRHSKPAIISYQNALLEKMTSPVDGDFFSGGQSPDSLYIQRVECIAIFRFQVNIYSTFP